MAAHDPTITGHFLRELREACGLPQAEVCRLTGLDLKTLYRVEHEVEGETSERARHIVAAALGVPHPEVWREGEVHS